MVLSVPKDATQSYSLPFGPFHPTDHRTLEIGLRSWVREQTGLSLGYVEQLYTFGDRGRHAVIGDKNPHVVSVGYLALTQRDACHTPMNGALWRPWYDFFPWEDWRQDNPQILSTMFPYFEEWIEQGADKQNRKERLLGVFGNGSVNNEELTLERYEFLYEAGLVREALRDGRATSLTWDHVPKFGSMMEFDHRRILATAIARLRGKLKYRPLVFELMDEQFTLTDLQQTAEALSGRHLHKQNFRRMIAASDLVEITGQHSSATGGRPAALYQFRKEAIARHRPSGLRI